MGIHPALGGERWIPGGEKQHDTSEHDEDIFGTDNLHNAAFPSGRRCVWKKNRSS
jgi:hypothetical protein